MKALNPFGYIEVATLTEKEPDDPKWICDEWSSEWTLKEDLDDLLDTIEEHVGEDPENFLDIKIEKIRNKTFMDTYIYDSPFDDIMNFFTKEECPVCEHLLVEADKVEKVGKFCSNHDCSYVDEKYTEYIENKRKLYERKEEPCIRLHDVGLNLKNFCKKYGIQLRDRDIKPCVVCKKEVVPSDWFLIKSGMAVISYEHENCKNNPCIMVPFSEKAKKQWSIL